MQTLKLFFLVYALSSLNACDYIRLASQRPILKVPDGNKDRIEKVMFSGSPKNPKYWLSRMTVVSKSFEGGDLSWSVFPGFQDNLKAGYFQFERDQMFFCNRVSRKFFENEKTGKQVLCDKIYAWDINHSSYRLAEVDGWTTNREEEDDYITWDKKAYFKTKLNQTNLNSEFPINKSCWDLKKQALNDKSRVIEDGYISFIVTATYELNQQCGTLKRYNDNNKIGTVAYKYSFKRVPDPLKPDPNYTPYQYAGENDPLRDKYGYFTTIRPGFQSDKRDKNIFYMNRWNPNKKHTFYFSKDYPEKYKHIAHGVICNTNKMFAKHGLNDYPLDGACKRDGSVLPKRNETCNTGICFELKDNSGQVLGDIRYSFFHLTDIPISTLGYGPSNANPATGEIVNGTVVIGTRHLDYMIDVSLEYIKEEERRYETSPVLIPITQILKMTSEEEAAQLNDRDYWTKSSIPFSQNRDLFNKFVSYFHFANPSFSRFTSSQLHNPGVKAHSMKEILLSYLKNIENHKHLQRFPKWDFFKKNLEATLSEEDVSSSLLSYSLDHSDPTQGTLYPAEFLESSVLRMAKSGLSREEMKKRVLFSLMAHEFGHALNLRHNFYGSVDSKHHHEHATTSSVMDYRTTKDESDDPDYAFFGPYDEAAIIYAYSDGKIDLSEEKGTEYLFCTDEDVSLNFLCQRWDYGDTVSKITQSLIENYDEAYIFRNFRNDRAYWGERGYLFSILHTMYQFKRPLALLDKFNNEKPNLSRIMSNEEINFLEQDLKQASKLSLSFYNAIIQLDDKERPWFNSYNSVTGSLESIGVLFDKIYATLFLMNDFGISEDPNQPVWNTSYLSYINDPDLKDIIEVIMENTLTQQIDTVPSFTNFGQMLYAQNSANFFNKRGIPEALEKIGFKCYTPKGLEKRFEINISKEDGTLETTPFTLKVTPAFKEPYYRTLLETEPFKSMNQGDLRLGVIYHDRNYYTSLSKINSYGFSIIDNLIELELSDENIRHSKEDIYFLHSLYNSFKAPFSNIECDDGSQ